MYSPNKYNTMRPVLATNTKYIADIASISPCYSSPNKNT